MFIFLNDSNWDSFIAPVQNHVGLFITFEAGFKLKQTFTFYSVYFLLHSVLSSSKIFFPFSFYFFYFYFSIISVPCFMPTHPLLSFAVYLISSFFLLFDVTYIIPFVLISFFFFGHTPLSFFIHIVYMLISPIPLLYFLLTSFASILFRSLLFFFHSTFSYFYFAFFFDFHQRNFTTIFLWPSILSIIFF